MVEHSPFKSSLVYRAYWRLQINRELLLGFGLGFLLGRVTQTPLQLWHTGRTVLPRPNATLCRDPLRNQAQATSR